MTHAGSGGSSGAPLSGVRVLEFGGVGPGPYGGMLLSDLGADVIRVDRPDGPPGEKRSLLNRGKRSVVVDLRHPDAKVAVKAMILSADVLIDPFRPGVMERLGLGPTVVQEWKRDLVYVRVTGWGQDGPYAHNAGHDLGYIAVTGLLDSVGEVGGPPQIPLNIAGDFGGGGTFLVIGVLAGLLKARSVGEGSVVDVAMADGAASLLAGTFTMLNGGRWVEQRGTNLLDGGAPFYSVYPTSDDRNLTVAPLEPKFFAEFVRLAELEVDLELQYDRTTWPALRSAIAERVRSKTLQEWVDVFTGTDACVAPVETLSSAVTNPQVRARGALIVDELGIQPGIAPRFAGQSPVPPPIGSSPGTGEHTREVLGELKVDVDALLASRAVRSPDDVGVRVAAR